MAEEELEVLELVEDDLDAELEADVVIVKPKKLSGKPMAPAMRAPEPPMKAPLAPEGIPVGEVEEAIARAEDYFGDEIKDLEPLQQLVIVGYLKTKNPTKACALCGASIMQHRRWLRENDLYREVFNAVHDAIGDLLEEESVNEAIRTKNPALLLGLLKGFKKDKYRPDKGSDKSEQLNSWADLAAKFAE